MPEPLIDVGALIDRIGPLTPAQAARAEALIADASALVRRYTRQTFTHVTDDQVVLRLIGSEVILPERPVTEVSQVVAIGGRPDVADVTIAGWLFDGVDRIQVQPFGWRTAIDLDLEWDVDSWSPDSYRVTYSHGYEEVPADVVAVVAAMANRVLTSPSIVEGLAGERIGNYSYQLQQGGGGSGPAVRLTTADKDDLADYRRKAGSIQLSGR